MFEKITGLLMDVTGRRFYRRYTFFDANNKPILLFKYLPLLFFNWTKAYNKKISAFFGAPAFCVGSGRMGLFLLLKAFGVGPGDEVVLTGYTCVVCPNAIVYLGATPIYVDVDPKTFGIDPVNLSGKLTSRTKVIVVQHTYGIPAAIEEIVAIAKTKGILVIEDCAHSLGGVYRGKKLGTFGDAAFFSSDHTKMISTSTGGGIVLNNRVFLDRLKPLIMDLPQLGLLQRARISFQYVFRGLIANPRLNWFGVYLSAVFSRLNVYFYFYDENIEQKDKITKYPYPVGLSNFQAYVGCFEFDRLTENLAHRSNIVKCFEELFGVNYNGIPLLMFPLLVRNPKRWKEALNPYVEVFDWFSKVAYGRKGEMTEIGYLDGSCPVAEQIAKLVITLPTNRYVDKLAIKILDELVRDNELINDIIRGEYFR